MTKVEVKNISKVYAGRTSVKALDNVNLAIRPGELFLLLGPSGCGKTTLLRIIAGLITPTSGTVSFNGKDITDMPVEKRDCAMVFQNYALWPHMTVDANVRFGPKMKKFSRQRQDAIVGRVLELVGMTGLAKRKPNELSGGQQQRVALARALAAEPACLLFDEPLSNLDAQLRIQMRMELRRLVKANNTTAIYVTHDQKEALSMADRIAVMNAGRISQVAEPQEIYYRPANRFVADFIGQANLIDGIVKYTTGGNIIETGICNIVPQNCLLPAGTKATCCIRPERLKISPFAAAGEKCGFETAARIDKIEFLGETCQYYLSAKNISLIATDVGFQRGLCPGMEVKISAHSDDIVVLAE